MNAFSESSALFAELALRGWFPRGIAILLALLALVAVGLVYFREAGRVPAWRRAVLAGLRATALLSIVFLLLRPSLLTEARGTRARPIALMVDNTQSMLTKDPRTNFADRFRLAIALDLVPPNTPIPTMPSAGDLPGQTPETLTRLDLVKSVLTNPRLNLLPSLAKVGPLQTASFGANRSSTDPSDANWIKDLSAAEPKTAIYDSTFELLKRDPNELPAAIVLVTDGRENASRHSLIELARECTRLRIPLHLYGTGVATIGEVQIRDAITPDTLFVDDTVTVPVHYRVRDLSAGKAEIVVTLNGHEVARKTVEVKEGDDLKEVLGFVPQQSDAQTGRQELTTTIRIENGLDSASDSITRSVRVVDRKMKVLMVDSIPRWEYKFLQRALLRDRRVEASFLLFQGDKLAMESGRPYLPKFPETREELFDYDLLILGDISADELTPEQQINVRDFVAEGGGLIQIAGRFHAPASYLRTPLADVLPVDFEQKQFAIDSNTRPEPFRPELTPAGVRSPLLSMNEIPDESLRIWRTLPPIYWTYPVMKLKPGAEALLVHPTEKTKDNKPMPLLASHFYGKGFVLFLGFDETWRWRFNEADHYFGRFWSQTVYVTGVPRTLGTKLAQLSLDTPDPQLGKTGQVYARLFTRDLKPLTTDRLDARLERLDVGATDKDRIMTVELKALPGAPGDYVATLPFNQVGRYSLKVDTGVAEGDLEYRVTLPPEHELSVGGMNEADLKQLAESTGGKFYREEDLHAMPQNIRQQTVSYTQREETLLWNRWALVWIIALLTAEWFLRKFNGLS